jgi:hypothetical protein
LKFFENLRRYSQRQGAPLVSMTPVANLPLVSTGVTDTGCKFDAGVNYTGGKFSTIINDRWQVLLPVPLVLLVLLIPVANLPPVSTILVENLPPVSTTPAANCHRYQQHQGTKSDCCNIKVTLKKKIDLCVNSTTQSCPKK